MHLMDLWTDINDTLQELAEADLLRNPVQLESACGPVVRLGGREVVCMCSNDYLSLANDEITRNAAIAAIQTWGVGSGASRLVSGTTSIHKQLELMLAEFEHAEDAVLTSTGWMANRVAIHAMAGKGDLILCDKLNHASIIDASKSSLAQMRTYAHRDTQRLESLLKRYRGQYRRCLIVTDSLFSMDGDVAPLQELVELKEQYGAQIMIDEAHATGVLGATGRGAAEMLGVAGRIDAVVGTLSKALGAMGGFVAGPKPLIDLIRNTGRAYIYTTALPVAMCAAAMAAVRFVQTDNQRRMHVLSLADYLRKRLSEMGFSTGGSASQIIPVLVGEPSAAVELSRRLLERGMLVPAIRPPTVPPGTSRLRVSLCSRHTQQQVDQFVTELRTLLSH